MAEICLLTTGKILPQNPPMSLNEYDFAVQRARESAERNELQKVADETGLGYSWLSKFSRGKIPGASYEKVTRLASYYTGAPH